MGSSELAINKCPRLWLGAKSAAMIFDGHSFGATVIFLVYIWKILTDRIAPGTSFYFETNTTERVYACANINNKKLLAIIISYDCCAFYVNFLTADAVFDQVFVIPIKDNEPDAEHSLKFRGTGRCEKTSKATVSFIFYFKAHVIFFLEDATMVIKQ